VDDPPKAEAQGGDEIKEEQLWQKSRKWGESYERKEFTKQQVDQNLTL
jgi:hypothetical protein